MPRHHPLDHAVWSSLAGAHAHFAEVVGQAARYEPDVAPFYGLAPGANGEAWEDLAALAGPGAAVLLAHGGSLPDPRFAPPDGWAVAHTTAGLQMVAERLEGVPDPEVVVLGSDDVPEMRELVARTRPGPFRPRTVLLGTYLGVREDGRLVAMAGERLQPGGWTEISAVCTDAAHRGQGLGTRLVRAVAVGVQARDETPFLHAAAANAGAVRLYGALGFAVRREVTFVELRTPGSER